MSSAGYAKPLAIEPGPSRLLACAVIAVHGGALLMIPPLPMSGWLCAGLALAIVISFVIVLAGPVLRLRGGAIVAVQWRVDGSWRVRTRNGEERDAVLLADSYVHPWVTVLNFRVMRGMRFADSAHAAGIAMVRYGLVWLVARRCSLVLLPDNVERETFRRLRARLRLEGAGTVGSGLR